MKMLSGNTTLKFLIISTFCLFFIISAQGKNTLLLKIIPTAAKKERKNILVNGDFSQDKKFPFGWIINNKNVSWISNKHLILFTLDKDTAETKGVWFYSIFYPIKSPSSWTLSIQAKTSGQQLIVFVEGWGIVTGRRMLIERNDCFFHPKGTKWERYSSKAIFENPNVKWIRLKVLAYLTPGKVLFRKISLYLKNNTPQ